MKPAGAACATCELENAGCVKSSLRDPTGHDFSVEAPMLKAFRGKVKLAVIGESPGRQEVIQGTGFIGPSGSMLWRALQRYGVNRSDCLVTNAALCDPGFEAGKDARARAGAKACKARLEAELEASGARVWLVLGDIAKKALVEPFVELSKTSKKKPRFPPRGTIVEQNGALILPVLHPAFVLRDPLWLSVFNNDIERVARVIQSGFTAPEDDPAHRRLPEPRTLRALESALAELGPVIGLDIETTKDAPTRCELLCIGVSDTQTTFVIPWPEASGWKEDVKAKDVAEMISRALCERTIVTHNGPAFDQIAIGRYGIRWAKWDDTLLAHHAFAGHMPQSLAHVTSMYVDARAWKAEHKPIIEEASDQKKFDLEEVSNKVKTPEQIEEELHDYNAKDCLYTALDWHRMQRDLDREFMCGDEKRSERRIYEGDKRIAEICQTMTLNGFLIDAERRKEFKGLLAEAQRQFYWKARQACGHPFKPLSPPQVGKILFGEFGVPILKYTNKGGKEGKRPSTSVDVLEKYSKLGSEELKAFCKNLILCRKANKLLKNYITGPIVEGEGRVHPGWKSFGAASGRLSCAKPNIANLPKRPQIEGINIREMYVSRPGFKLVSFDWKQLEMRIAAYVSHDPVMIAACESEDMHLENAKLIFGALFEKAACIVGGEDCKCPGCKARKIMRQAAKTAGFACNYGAGEEKIADKFEGDGIEVPNGNYRGAARSMLQALNKAFPIFFDWKKKVLYEAMKTGVVRTPIWGRKRYVGHAPDATVVGNHPIQGGAADVMNTKLPRLVEAVPSEALLVAQVYDQCIFETPDRLVDEVKGICKEIAESPIEIGGELRVLPVDVSVGERWSDL